MKKGTYTIMAVVLLLVLGSCKEATSQEKITDSPAQKEVQKQQTIALIAPAALEEKMKDPEIQLVDVRTDREWDQGHLKNAKHFEINNANWESQISTLDKDQPVYVYCAKGGRSARCAKKLKEAGFTEIYDLDGGITDWKAAGKSVE